MSQQLTNIAPAPLALRVSEQEFAEFQEAYAVNIASGSISEFDLPRIKLMKGEALFKIPTLEGFTTAKSIECVIVLARDTRAYYQGDEIKNQPPDCSSIDGITGSARPGVHLGGSCASCPMNRWETGKNGSKACKEGKQMFILRGESMFLEVLTLGPTSLKSVRQYFLQLATQRFPYYKCILRIDLAETKNSQQQTYGKASINFVRRLNEEETAQVMKLKAMAESMAGRIGAEAAEPAE